MLASRVCRWVPERYTQGVCGSNPSHLRPLGRRRWRDTPWFGYSWRSLRGRGGRMERICVFCGSSSGDRAEYTEAAARLGAALARREIELVYGGGNVGLMGTLADAALSAGGRVTGVIPGALAAREVAHLGL